MGARVLLAGIYGIVDTAAVPEPVPFLDALLRAGVRVVQYRAKRGIERTLLDAMCSKARLYGASLIVNDDFEAALLADGWHAGQEDLAGLDVLALRARLGGRIFGISAGTALEARAAEVAGADYVGVGPFAATASKDDAGAAIGAAGIARVVRATRLPVVAIGGIDYESLMAVAASGAAMAAVISAFARSPEPEATARAFIARWQSCVR